MQRKTITHAFTVEIVPPGPTRTNAKRPPTKCTGLGSPANAGPPPAPLPSRGQPLAPLNDPPPPAPAQGPDPALLQLAADVAKALGVDAADLDGVESAFNYLMTQLRATQAQARRLGLTISEWQSCTAVGADPKKFADQKFTRMSAKMKRGQR